MRAYMRGCMRCRVGVCCDVRCDGGCLGAPARSEMAAGTISTTKEEQDRAEQDTLVMASKSVRGWRQRGEGAGPC